VSLSPDGQLVASASDGPIVCHRYGPLGLPPQVFGVAAVGCGPDYGIVRLFDLSTGQELGSLKHQGTAHSVSFSPDGKLLASGGGGAAKLWDLAAGSASTIIEGGDGVEVYCVSFSPDGLTLAVGVGSRDFGGSQDEVRLWDLKMGHERAVLSGRRGKVRSLAFSPDGKALVTGSGEAVVLWDLPKLQDTQNHGLLPCLPAQNGQNGQSSPNEKSSGLISGRSSGNALKKKSFSP
jgi:WD40 repeat protein